MVWTVFNALVSLNPLLVVQSSGSVNDVPPGMIKDLDQGKAYLQIVSGPDDKAVFKGNVRFFLY